MNIRAVLLGGAALLLAVVGGTGAWYALDGAPAEADAEVDFGVLPLPPVPPRITTGLEYDRCLGMLTTDPSGAAALARAWQGRGGGDGATHCLALSRIALGEPEPAAAMLEALAAASSAPPVTRAILLFQASQAWMMAEDPRRAFAAATLALTLSPDDPNLLVERASAAAALERYQEAADDLARALVIDANRSDALVLRASALRHLDQLVAALDDINRALALDPDNAEALLERGILRQRGNDRAGARADWQRAIELAPDSPAADLAQQNLALLEAGPQR